MSSITRAKKCFWWLSVDNFYLSDFLNPLFIEQAAQATGECENVVLYNPKKGKKFTSHLMRAASDLKWRALENMTREEMAAALQSVKVYIDFGNHPGKDRIPREAAISGCLLVTGLDGSAAFSEDVPIPAEYKIAARRENIGQIIATIKELMANYEQHYAELEPYRGFIRGEKVVFERGAVEIFTKLVNGAD